MIKQTVRDPPLCATCRRLRWVRHGRRLARLTRGRLLRRPVSDRQGQLRFVSKYKRGTIVPTGQTQFQFRVPDLNFHSTYYEWRLEYGSGTVSEDRMIGPVEWIV